MGKCIEINIPGVTPEPIYFEGVENFDPYEIVKELTDSSSYINI
ncbi:MAG: hypothetical protein Nk1A_8150 [Endomicrobiia bacterium]|nr:MAG: hypothetical protein Nk1A_8150 [Endomicrobiia bacterium]